MREACEVLGSIHSTEIEKKKISYDLCGYEMDEV
jgi:hypothetical protein